MPKVAPAQLEARRGQILDGLPAGVRAARLRGRDGQGPRGRDRPVAGRDLPPLPRQGGAVPRPRGGGRRPHRRRRRRARPRAGHARARRARRRLARRAARGAPPAAHRPGLRRALGRAPVGRRPGHRRAPGAPARGRGRARRRARSPLLADFLRLVLDGLVSSLAAGMPSEHLSGVLDLVEDAVRRPSACACAVPSPGAPSSEAPVSVLPAHSTAQEAPHAQH